LVAPKVEGRSDVFNSNLKKERRGPGDSERQGEKKILFPYAQKNPLLSFH